VPSLLVGSTDFSAGMADAFFFAVGAPPVANAATAVMGLRALPLDTSPAAIARLQAIYPNSYPVTVAANPNLPGFAAQTATLAYDNVLLANAGLSNDLVRRIAQILSENKAQLVAANAAWNDFDPARMYRPLATPFHPGAIAYYTR
jgi:TRAP-type uncharacterized transport system substrate-binding protein